MSKTKKGDQFSVRFDDRVEKAVEEWLKKHPGVTRSAFMNMAAWNFATEPQTLEAVDRTENDGLSKTSQVETKISR